MKKMTGHIFRIFCLFCLAGIFLFPDPAAAGENSPESKRVLILFSTRITNETRQQISNTLFRNIRPSESFSIDVSEMNSEEEPEPEKWRERFHEKIQVLREGRFHAVAATGHAACEMLAEHANEIPESTALIFYGTWMPEFDRIKTRKNVYFLICRDIPEPNIRLAAQIFPETAQVILVSPAILADTLPEGQTVSIREGSDASLKVLLPESLSPQALNRLSVELGKAYEDSALIFSGWDRIGTPLEDQREALRRIAFAYQGPVFVTNSELVPLAFGGVVKSLKKDGLAIAETISAILDGESVPGNIPSSEHLDFNWDNFLARGLSENDFPAATEFHGRPREFLELFKKEVLTAGSILAVLCAFFAGVSIYLFKYKRSTLRNIAISDSLPIRMYVFDRDGKILFFHQEYTPAAQYEGPVLTHLSQIPDINPGHFLACIESVIMTGRSVNYDYKSAGISYSATFSLIPPDVFSREAVIMTSQDTTDLQTFILQDETVNACMETLLLNTGFDFSLDSVQKRVGTLLNADVCAVYRLPSLRNTPRRVAPLALWTCDGEKRTAAQEPARADAVFRIFEPHVVKGETVVLSLDNISVLTQKWQIEALAFMREYKVRELICRGIYFDGKCWGFICVEKGVSDPRFRRTGERMIRATTRIIELLLCHDANRKDLEHSENEKRMILNMLRIPIFLFDSGMRIVNVNPAALAMLGKDAEGILDKPCHSGRCEDCPFQFKSETCPLAKAVRTKSPVAEERRINGRDYLVGTQSVLENGRVSGVLMTLVDMTESNKSRELLRKALRKAEEAAKAKSLFLATMSHELRTPLNAVIGFSELLQDDAIQTESRMEFLRAINSAGKSLLNLINDILDLSKIEADQVRIVPELADPRGVCEETMDIFRHMAVQKNITLTLTCGSIPPLFLDKLRVKQVLLNIIGNAVKFTSAGGVSVHCGFTPGKNGRGTLSIAVKDTGVGIAREYRRKIFEPFVQDQVMRGTRAEMGTGLGLPIAARLVSRMGGSIELESEPGKGSTFTVVLRNLAWGETPLQKNPETPEGKAKDAEQERKLVFLLVDDVPMNLRVLGSMIGKIGYEYRSVSSAKAALAMLETFRPDWVLTDIWMPEMNGAVLAKTIRADRRFDGIRIAAVTADNESDKNYDVSSFDQILLKPVTLDTLRKSFS